MKKIILNALFCLLPASSLLAQSANDTVHFKAAEAALKKKDCGTALHELQQVTIDGKDDIRYLELMGGMHECKGNREEAVFFYRKYQALRPNDTTQFKINYLEADVEKNGGARDKRNVNYKSTNGKYNLFNLAAMAITGKKNECNYNSGFKLTLNRGMPAFNKHAVLEYGVDVGILTSPNKTWFADALYVYPEDIKTIGIGFNPGFNISLMAVLYKNKKLSVAAGPMGGVSMFAAINHEYSQLGGGSVNDDNFIWNSAMLGLKAKFYYKHKFTAFAEYNKVMRSKLNVNTLYGEYSSIPIKMSVISIGIGIFM